MSSLWRSAVEYHARELTAIHAYALSLIADDANEAGFAVVDIGTLAYRGRCDDREARRWVAALVDAGAVTKRRGGLEIARRFLSCPVDYRGDATCLCPRAVLPVLEAATSAADTTIDLSAPNIGPVINIGLSEIDPFARIQAPAPLPPSPLADCALKMAAAWRHRFDTEPPPGMLIRALKESGIGESAFNELPLAFERYLAGLKSAMFLSVPKFLSTWRSYVGAWTSEVPKNVAAFNAAFRTHPRFLPPGGENL